ncbi:hypothetical protein D3C80_1356120 [compost metagenome]
MECRSPGDDAVQIEHGGVERARVQDKALVDCDTGRLTHVAELSTAGPARANGSTLRRSCRFPVSLCGDRRHFPTASPLASQEIPVDGERGCAIDAPLMEA